MAPGSSGRPIWVRGLVATAVAGVLAAIPAAASAEPANQAPVAAPDAVTAVQGHEKVFAAPGVLANDTDADGDALTASIVTGASNGSLSLRPDGSFTYTSAPGFTGTDTFAYRASDGTELSDTVLVSISVRSETQAFVAAVYRDFLGREPDPSGLAFWSRRLDSGYESRAFFLHRMARSHEYSVKVVNRLFLDVLERPVDPSGREYWAVRIQRGFTVGGLLQQLLGSHEFFRKWGGTSGGFVDQLYAAVLDRAPTPAERSEAIARVEAGTKRQRVAHQLYQSLDSRERRARVQYLDLLDREPDAAELEAAAELLGSPATGDPDLAEAIAAGAEYVAAAIAEG